MKLFILVILTLSFTLTIFTTETALAREEIAKQRQDRRQAHRKAFRSTEKGERQAQREELQERRQDRRQNRKQRRAELKDAHQNLPAVRSPASLESHKIKKKRRRIRRHKRDN